MSTLAEHIIVAGAENHPPMLVKSMYDSWASRIRLFINGKKHGRMMLDSIDNEKPTPSSKSESPPPYLTQKTRNLSQIRKDCSRAEEDALI
ncbi:hypothetical protein Tco_0827158 [Tanacetum coccineum]